MNLQLLHGVTMTVLQGLVAVMGCVRSFLTASQTNTYVRTS